MPVFRPRCRYVLSPWSKWPECFRLFGGLDFAGREQRRGLASQKIELDIWCGLNVSRHLERFARAIQHAKEFIVGRSGGRSFGRRRNRFFEATILGCTEVFRLWLGPKRRIKLVAHFRVSLERNHPWLVRRTWVHPPTAAGRPAAVDLGLAAEIEVQFVRRLVVELRIGPQ